MLKLVRDDVAWSDWLALRRRAYGKSADDVAALAGELDDWPDSVRLVASDPEQRVDEWWAEGWESAPQPWLALVRALWVPPEEIVDLEPASAWMREGLGRITTWVVEEDLAAETTTQCRSRLPALTTIDLTRFAAGTKRLGAWIERLAPVDQLALGGVAANAGVLDSIVAAHGRTLAGLVLSRVGPGLATLRRLSAWPAGSHLRHVALRDDSLDLALFARVTLPWLADLVSLDLAQAGDAGREYHWLRAPKLTSLSFNGARLADRATVLFRQAYLPQLRALRLASTGIDVEGLRAAVTAPWSAGLACLDLRDNLLPDEALDILTRPAFPGWSQLLLAGNRFSEGSVDRFAERHRLREQRPAVFVQVG